MNVLVDLPVRSCSALAVLVLTASLDARAAQSDTPPGVFGEERKLAPSLGDGKADLYGVCASLDRDQAAIGAPKADLGGTDRGAVFVLRDDGTDWSELQVLTASDAADGDGFGNAVSMHDDLLVVGSSGHDAVAADSGAAYVFRWNGTQWTEEQELVPSDAAAGNGFGVSVVVRDGSIAVGSWADDEKVENGGSVHVFTWNGSSFVERQKLVPDDLGGFDHFGSAVDLGGERLLVGALSHAAAGKNAGAAYVYRWSGAAFDLEQKLLPADLEQGDGFSHSLGIDDDWIAVGAPWDNEPDLDTGSVTVYHFDGSTWNLEQKLLSGGAFVQPYFGTSLCLRDGFLAVGAERSFGRASVFHLLDGEWREATWIRPVDTLGLGAAVSVDRSGLLVTDQGHAFLRRKLGDACTVRRERDVFAHGATYLSTWSTLAADDDVAVLGGGDTEVYERSGAAWSYVQDLAWGGASARFGASAAVFDPSIVVGAPGSQSFRGAAVVYRRGAGWQEEQVLQPAGVQPGEWFGQSVAGSGDWVVAGSPYLGQGRAYAFEFDGAHWIERQTLTASDGASGDEFGAAADLEGDVLVVGAPTSNAAGSSIGAVYVFRRSGSSWTQEQRLDPSDLSVARFGRGVALDGDAIAVESAQAVFVFRWNGSSWVEEAELAAAWGIPDSLDLAGDRLLVGMAEPSAPRQRPDLAVTFVRGPSGWQEHWVLARGDVAAALPCESAVAIAGPDLLSVGRSSADTLEILRFAPGLALDLTPTPANEGELATLTLCDGLPGGLGLIAAISIDGVPTFLPLLLGHFSAEGRLVLGAPVPPGLAGVHATLLGLGFEAPGHLAATRTAQLEVLAARVR